MSVGIRCSAASSLATQVFHVADIYASILSYVHYFVGSGPYLFINAVQLHCSVQAPLGQSFPVPDSMTNFFQVHSLLLSLVFFGMFLVRCISLDTMSLQKENLTPNLNINDTWYFFGCGLLFAARAYRSRNLSQHIKKAFCDTANYPRDWFDRTDPLGNDKGSHLFRLPWYARLHPFFLNLTSPDLSGLEGNVHIYEVTIPPTAKSNNSEATESSKDGLLQNKNSFSSLLVDIWTNSKREENNTARAGKKPVFMFLHGGGWLGGYRRMHASVSLLQNLAARGWLVISVGYRKTWPLQAEDPYAVYRWVSGTFVGLHISFIHSYMTFIHIRFIYILMIIFHTCANLYIYLLYAMLIVGDTDLH